MADAIHYIEQINHTSSDEARCLGGDPQSTLSNVYIYEDEDPDAGVQAI